jgi:hypothetical protein
VSEDPISEDESIRSPVKRSKPEFAVKPEPGIKGETRPYQLGLMATSDGFEVSVDISFEFWIIVKNNRFQYDPPSIDFEAILL